MGMTVHGAHHHFCDPSHNDYVIINYDCVVIICQAGSNLLGSLRTAGRRYQ
jgi:hypothetical protein